MSAVGVVAEALEDALREVDGLGVQRQEGQLVSPPAAVIGPPTLSWNGVCGPTSCRFPVMLVVSNAERAMERLWDLLPVVADAIDSVTDAVITEASPGTFQDGNTTLPCYQLTVEASIR